MRPDDSSIAKIVSEMPYPDTPDYIIGEVLTPRVAYIYGAADQRQLAAEVGYRQVPSVEEIGDYIHRMSPVVFNYKPYRMTVATELHLWLLGDKE